MKTLKKERVVNMKQVEHTNDERRMLKLAQHPFIIRMWGTFQDCRNLFMIMDYIEGGNLQNGSDDVKNHPWFKEVIWERLLSRDIETPYEPPITSGVGDTSQFDRYPEDKELDYGISGVGDPYGSLFNDF
ncbi:hypothetical protein QCA50_019488 [Cerrena zonata]|uniref:cAMP-dependent protein kinase n=1 Tax=Cerrena zonata TaxID=2478898 RepID=A0AAW0FDV3_9APHY